MNSILVLAAALTVDFATAVGPVRPEIHSSGFGPTICSQTAQDLKDVKSMGFKYARTTTGLSSTQTSASATTSISSRSCTST